MWFKWKWIYPTFFLGISLSHKFGYYIVGFGFWALTIYDQFAPIICEKSLTELFAEEKNGNGKS
jgi:hypothetical protein